MSLVTTAMLLSSRNARHSASNSAVLPLPTGPPMPTVKARAWKSRASGAGGSSDAPARGGAPDERGGAFFERAGAVRIAMVGGLAGDVVHRERSQDWKSRE